jgi:hypothetical protein
MKIQITVSLDTDVPEQKAILERLADLSEKPLDSFTGMTKRNLFIRHILKTKVGRRLILPAAERYGPGENFTMSDLAELIDVGFTQPEITKQRRVEIVFAWIRQLGRPEKKWDMKLFNVKKEEDKPVSYSFVPEMLEAIWDYRRVTQNKGTN